MEAILEARLAEMKSRMDEQARSMEARLNENSRLLQVVTEELEKERSSRRNDSVEAGREPGSPTIAESDRSQDSLLNRFVEQLQLQSGRGAVGATSSSTIAPSSEPQARPGTLVMANIPKFGGDSSKGFVRIKLIVSWAMSTNCCDALTAGVPVKLGGGKTLVELERTDSEVNITREKTAWRGLLNKANYPPLLDAVLAAGSPPEAWTVILAWYSPNDETAEYRTMREFEILALSD